MEGFKQLSIVEQRQISGGIAPALIALIPLGIEIFNSLIAGLKMLSSSKGELKDKTATYKWDN